MGFFQSIIEFFTMICDLILNTIQTLFTVLGYIFSAQVFLSNVVWIFPPFLASAFVLFVSILVIRFILLK